MSKGLSVTYPTNWRQRLWRLWYNLHPAIRGTGSFMTHLSANWQEAHIVLPLWFRTRNYLGTLFGGSMFAAADPVLLVMLIKILGPDYVVWDKSASIRYVRPGTGTLYLRFLVTETDLTTIREAVAVQGKTDHRFFLEYRNAAGELISRVEKVLFLADKARFSQKNNQPNP